tara:strand:+ start:1373 stop:1846 length:474 start_codon:yes stop_codon:yes gene_type:complete
LKELQKNNKEVIKIIKREYPDRPISAVASLVIYKDNLLLVKKNKSDNLWSLPGGAVELGETLETALKREVMEETTIEIEVLSLINNLDIIRFDNNKNIRLHYVLSIYEGKYIDGEPKYGDDVVDAAWHKLHKLDTISLLDGTRAVLSQHLNARNYYL